MNPRYLQRVTAAIGLTLALIPLCFVVGIPFFQRPEQPTLDFVDDVAEPQETQPRTRVALRDHEGAEIQLEPRPQKPIDSDIEDTGVSHVTEPAVPDSSPVPLPPDDSGTPVPAVPFFPRTSNQ